MKLKKIFIVLVALIVGSAILFSFVACEKNSNVPKPEETNSESGTGTKNEELNNEEPKTKEPIVERYEDFLTLNQAYERGYLTKDDLLNIHHYYYDREEQYSPGLSDEQKRTIENTLFEIVNEEKENTRYKDTIFTLDQAHVIGYYGTYNGCIAVCLTFGEGPFPASCVIWEENVGDVIFVHPEHISYFSSEKYSFDNRVFIWKTNVKE